MTKHLNTLTKRTLILIVFFCCFKNSAISQSENWKEYYANDHARIEYKTVICDFSSTATQEMIIFKYTNLSISSITITYTTNISHKNSEINTEQNLEEFRKTIKIPQGKTIETNCESRWNEYNIFRGFFENNTGERYIYLTEFSLENLKIENE